MKTKDGSDPFKLKSMKQAPQSSRPSTTSKASGKKNNKKVLIRKKDAMDPNNIETASTFFPGTFPDTPGWFNRHYDDFCYYAHYVR